MTGEKKTKDFTLEQVREICENNVCKFCPLYNRMVGFCGVNDTFPKDWEFRDWRKQ